MCSTCRPVAKKFEVGGGKKMLRREIVLRGIATRGVWGHAPPEKVSIKDILRWFLVHSGK